MPTRVKVEGFKSIRSIDLELRKLNVLIGANGAGKSNLVQAFDLLSNILSGRLQTTIARAGGAGSLLHHGPKITDRIRLRCEESPNTVVFYLPEARRDTA